MTKQLKKMVAVLLACGMIAMLAACNNNTTSSSSSASSDASSSQTASETVSGEESAAGSSEPASGETASGSTESQAAESAVSESPSSVEGTPMEHMMKGTIEDATMNSFVLKTSDGSITFPIGADTNLSNLPDGLKIGEEVYVMYTGNVDGTDGSGTTVTRVNPTQKD